MPVVKVRLACLFCLGSILVALQHELLAVQLPHLLRKRHLESRLLLFFVLDRGQPQRRANYHTRWKSCGPCRPGEKTGTRPSSFRRHRCHRQGLMGSAVASCLSENDCTRTLPSYPSTAPRIIERPANSRSLLSTQSFRAFTPFGIVGPLPEVFELPLDLLRPATVAVREKREIGPGFRGSFGQSRIAHGTTSSFTTRWCHDTRCLNPAGVSLLPES